MTRKVLLALYAILGQNCDYETFSMQMVNDLYVFESEPDSACFEIIERKILEDSSGEKEIRIAKPRDKQYVNNRSSTNDENSPNIQSPVTDESGQQLVPEQGRLPTATSATTSENTTDSYSQVFGNGQNSQTNDQTVGQSVFGASKENSNDLQVGIVFEDNSVSLAVENLGNYTASWQNDLITVKGEGSLKIRDGLYLSPTFSKPLKYMQVVSKNNRFEILAYVDSTNTRVESDTGQIKFRVY